MTSPERVMRLRHADLSWTPTAQGEVIALDLTASRYFSANSSAAELWTRLAQGATRPELEAALVANFGITAEVARDDVEDFIAELQSRGLLAEPT